MKVLLDIKDNKADFILELLKGFPSYVKAKPISFTKEQKDWWDELNESQQKAIDESIAEMKAGKLTSHVDVMKKYKKWMKK